MPIIEASDRFPDDPAASTLITDLLSVIDAHAGKVNYMTLIGVLEIVKLTIMLEEEE